MCHPVCMADESGPGWGCWRAERRLWRWVQGQCKHQVPHLSMALQQFHRFFWSKGTIVVLVIKVFFLVLSKCGPDISPCSCSPCAVPLNLSAQKYPRYWKRKGDVNTWTADVSSLPSGTTRRRVCRGAEQVAEAGVPEDPSLQVWPLQQISSFFLCYHVLLPRALKSRQVWKVCGCETIEEKCCQKPLIKKQFYFCSVAGVLLRTDSVSSSHSSQISSPGHCQRKDTGLANSGSTVLTTYSHSKILFIKKPSQAPSTTATTPVLVVYFKWCLHYTA